MKNGNENEVIWIKKKIARNEKYCF